MDDNDILLYGAIGLGIVLLMRNPNALRAQPVTVARTDPGGAFSVAIPGLGSYATRGGATQLALDPNILARFFPNTRQQGQEVPYPGGFVPMPGAAVPDPVAQPPATQDYAPADSPAFTTPGFDDYRAGERGAYAVDQPGSYAVDPAPTPDDYYPPDTNAPVITDPALIDPWYNMDGYSWDWMTI